MQKLIGQSFGRYHITEQLGEGGMAVVYKAYDTRLERDVAVKVIRKNAFSSDVLERVLKRFDREAKSLAKLTHPNIVSLIDYGDFEGSPYLVMPYLAGGTLKQFLGKPLSWQEAVKMLVPIADALAYAHRKGIIHRDVKPGNILITEDGAPMLADFGIARLLESEDSQTLTGTGVGVGTPEYMAPEQGLGKEVDGRADVYSLGVVLFELVTGRKPYTADTPMAVVLKHMTDPLPRPGEIVHGLPDAVERMLFKALAKDAADRYQSMEEFGTALKKLENAAAAVQPTKPAEMDQAALSALQDVNPAESEDLATVVQFETSPQPPELSVPRTPPEPAIGKGKGNRSGIIALGVAGIGILVLLIGVASGWFAAKRSLAMTSAATVTAAPATKAPTSTKPAATKTPVASATPSGIGRTQVSPKDGMIMVYVPAGEFSMGSNEGDGDEQPVLTVYLDAYWIDQTEVTNAMYEKCVAAGGCSEPEEIKSNTKTSYYGNSTYADFPVINVDWYQADNYCQWAGRELPTEAQWEKAARGTDGRTFPWGNDSPNKDLANYNNYVGDTTAVGTYPDGASPYGAYDMAGNVWEWVADWYGDYPAEAVSNPTGPDSGEYRVLRGGSWSDDENYTRSSDRNRSFPSSWFSYFGFRCATSLP